MSNEAIETAALEIATLTKGSAQDIRVILERNFDASGLDRMTVALRTPWPWVTGVVGVWAEGLIPQSDLDKVLVGVTLGAAVEAIGTYLRRRGLQRTGGVLPILTPAEIELLKVPETAGAPRKLIVGSINEIQVATHYQPRVRALNEDDLLWQRAIRVAQNNPRFMRLIV